VRRRCSWRWQQPNGGSTCGCMGEACSCGLLQLEGSPAGWRGRSLCSAQPRLVCLFVCTTRCSFRRPRLVPCWLVVLAAPVHYNLKKSKKKYTLSSFCVIVGLAMARAVWPFLCILAATVMLMSVAAAVAVGGLQLSSNSSGMHSPYAFTLRALLSLYLRCLRIVGGVHCVAGGLD